MTSRQFLGLERTALIFFVIFASMFIWNAGSCVFDVSRGSWPTTSGRIEKVEALSGPTGGASALRVYYSYEAGSQNFDSNTYFAPGSAQPAGGAYSAGQQTQVYYNSIFPGMSTLSPTSQCGLYVAYMILGAVGAIITLLGRPKLSLGGDFRAELPNFLDCLVALIESGVSIPAAFEQAAATCSGSCPKLSSQVSRCVFKLKVNRIPLHQSLAELGATYKVDELNNLASTLAAAELTGSSVAYQIKQQSAALRYHLRAEQLAAENAATNLGVRRNSSSKRSWNTANRSGPMGAEEILESLEPERDEK